MDTTIKENWFKLSLPEQMVNIGNRTLDCTKEQILNYYLAFTNLL